MALFNKTDNFPQPFFSLLVCFWLLVPIGILAQDEYQIPGKRCPVNTINYSQGLMTNSLVDIITDRQGFSWVSTAVGLQRFNGYSLQPITPVVANDTIAINYPVHFVEGLNHTILIGYRQGILEYQDEKNAFRKLITLAASSVSDYSVMPIRQIKEGIWCFEEDKGLVLYRFDGSRAGYIAGTEHANLEDLLRAEDYNITRKLAASNDHFIFMRVTDHRLLKIDLLTSQTIYIEYPGPPILAIECNKNKLFIANVEGLVSMDLNDGTFSKMFLFKKVSYFGASRSSIQFFDNRLLVTVEKRLFEFDTSCRLLREIVPLNQQSLLHSGYIQFAYEDRFRRIWLLTHEDIKRIQDAETPFEHYTYPAKKENFERCIYYDKEKNQLLTGDYVGAVHWYDSAGRRLSDKPLTTEGLQSISAIEKLSNDRYLLLTLEKGPFILRPNEKKISRMDVSRFPELQAGAGKFTYSNNLQRIDDSTLLICAKSNVFRCEIRNQLIASIQPLLRPEQVKPFQLSCLYYASNKTLWVTTLSGNILKMDSLGNLERVDKPGNYVVRCITEDGKRNIWVGTERGILIYDASGKLEHSYGRQAGLLSDYIYELLPADSSKNNFFASTNFGLSYVSSDGVVKNFTRELGLQENEFNTQSGAISPEGKLFFGGINGVTAFYPAQLARVDDSSLINITGLRVNDTLLTAYGGAWSGDTLQLAYNQNHIQFDIAATGLLDPGEYLYKYRLNNFEKSWQTTNRATGIRYTLQPGRYLLEIRCSPSFFSRKEIVKKLVIIISPPFWKTWWFMLLVLLLSVAIVFGMSYYVVWQRYQLKSRKLEMKQQLVLERERISRELHDNIGSQLSYISNNIDWLSETHGALSKEEELKRLGIVSDTAKNMVADLRQTIWAMKKESIMLDELADKLKSFLQSQCILKPSLDVVISEHIESNQHFSPTEALNIFRTCQEAIANSIRHSQAESLIFTIQSGPDARFAFSIKDNGRGFDQNRLYPDHYGLENMRNRTRESNLELYIQSQPGKGTLVRISSQGYTKS